MIADIEDADADTMLGQHEEVPRQMLLSIDNVDLDGMTIPLPPLTHFHQWFRLCSCGTKPQRSKNHHSVMTSSWEPQCHHDIIMRTPRITGKPRFSCSRGPKATLTKIRLL